MTTNAKIATGAAAVVLLLLGWTLAGGDPAAPGDSAGAGSVHETGSLPPPPEPAPLPAGDTDDADDGTGAAAAVAAGEDAGATGEKPGPLEFALLPPPAPEVPETTDAPAPTRAPRTWTQAELEEAGITIGGTGGGFQPGRMGPVPGKRSKWAPVPEKGTVTVRGRVVDLQGRPLAGAEVLRLEPAAGGAEGDVVSFAHIRTAGTAGADGRFELREQPARAWRLGGNWHRSQNRDRGYAVPRTVSMEPAEHDVVEGVEIVVPVDASRVGALHGRVTDDTGRPLRNVRVFAGFTEARSKRDGTWALPVVAAGDVLVRVGKFGYEEFARTVPLAPGQDVAVAIELVRRNAGSLAVEGRVVDETGAPVADFPVWLGGHLHLSRDGRTDAAGRFRFKGLADRLAGKTVVVSTMGNPDEAGILNTTRKDVPVSGEPVTITVVRTTRCRIHMLDALSEEPQTLIRMTVEREVDGAGGPELKSFRSMSVHDEDGVIEIALPRGRVVLTIETPDHAVVRGEFTVPGVDHEHDVRVLMPPR